jgi:dihydrodipicolinate synthase/N-acetylneuraminate lyase
MTTLQGTYAAAVTPFKDGPGREVDVEAYLGHLSWLAESGLDGVVAFGTNGEGPSVSLGEKLAALDKVFDAGVGVQVVPTVAEANAVDALSFVRRLADTPAAAVMVLPPYYFKPVDAEGLRVFYEEILAVAAQPVVVYHIPKYAVGVPAELVVDLPVWGVKDSGGEDAYAREVLAGGRGVLLGTENELWDRLDLGPQGLISALANVVPEQLAALYRAHRDGDAETGRRLQAGLSELRKATKTYASPGMLKRLAQRRHGVPMGTVRPPLLPPPADVDLTSALAAVGLE